MKKWIKSNPVISTLFFLALISFLWLLIDAYPSDNPIFSTPVTIKKGVILEQEFSAGHSSDYIIGLEAERGVEEKELSCLFGRNDEEKAACPDKLKLSWEVYQGNTLIKSGDSPYVGITSWGKKVSKNFGRFSAEKFKHYRLLVKGPEDHPDFSVLAPQITVSRHAVLGDSNFMLGLCCLLLGSLSVTLAVVFLVVKKLKKRARR